MLENEVIKYEIIVLLEFVTRSQKCGEECVSGFLFLFAFCGDHRFISDQFLLWLYFSSKENKRRTFYAKFVLRKIEQKKWMKEVLATTCRQFMFIISIENERVGESCVITTKEWEGMHNSGKSKDFPPFSVLRNLWEILDWSSSSSQNWKSFYIF